MKIVQIGKYYYPYKGGIENHLKILCDNLVEIGENVEVNVFNSGFFSKKDKIDNVEVYRSGKLFEMFSTPLSPAMIFKLIQTDGDIIHIHAPNPSAHMALYFAQFFKKKKAKLVITHHSDIVSQKIAYKFYKPYLEKLYIKADGIIVATENHIEYSDILKNYREKIKVIPYGVDIESFKITDEIKKRVHKIKKNLGGRKTALFIGRLVYYKGVSVLIEAFNKPELKDTNLIIIGNGPYFSTLKAQAMENQNIIFIPEADDIQLKTFLHASDFFILPSVEKSEAFGIVQIEAMACRKPVISTRLDSGVKAVNIHEKTGMTVEPGNAEELKNAVIKLINDNEKYNLYAENAFSHVEEKFSSKKTALQILKFYKELVN